jgi:hypothetical protein
MSFGKVANLAEPRSARTRIEREFDPGAIRRLKADAQHVSMRCRWSNLR